MHQQFPQNSQSPHGLNQYNSAKKDGGAVVRETSTYLTDPQAQRICEIFAEGLDSGLGYARIMNFLERKGVKGSVVNRMRRALIEDGAALSETFARYGLLDPAARKLILVAEKQGTLPQAFRTQIPIYANRYKRKKHVLGACAEPTLLFYLSVFLLLPIMSNIDTIYKSRDGIGSAVGQVVLGPATMGMFAVLFLIGLGWAWLHTPVDFALRDAFASVWMRLPIISKASRLYSISLFARYLGSSLGSGMNIFDSIQLACEASNDPRLSARLEHVFASIEDGVSLSASLSLNKAIPDDIIEYIDLGEETGRMSEMLERGANAFEERSLEVFARTMTAFTYVLRFVLGFGVMGAVLFKMLGSLGGMFSDAMENTAVVPMFYLHCKLRAWLKSPEE